MIIAFIGRRGSGKTASMVRYAIDKYNKGYNVYTNLGLKFKDNKKSKIILLDKHFFENYKNCGFDVINSLVIVDEAHVFIDSRRSISKTNILFSKFLSQSRKRTVDVIYSTQDLSVQYFLSSGQVDLRVRKLTDWIIFCEYYNYQGKSYIVNHIHDQYGFLIKNEVYQADDYFKLYDTNEIIDIE